VTCSAVMSRFVKEFSWGTQMAAAMIHQHHEALQRLELEAHKEDPSCLQGRPPERRTRALPIASFLPCLQLGRIYRPRGMEAAKSTGSESFAPDCHSQRLLSARRRHRTFWCQSDRVAAS
jgi:hypothetical protein